MIIEIESVYGDCYLHGKTISINDLNKQLKNVLLDVDEKGFVTLFCSRFGYEILQVDEIHEIEFSIDLDTHKIYKPHY